GAVGCSIASDSCVGKIEVGTIGSEQVRCARHQIAELRVCFLHIAEADLAECTTEIGIHLIDLVLGVGLALKFNLSTYRDAIGQCCLAVKMNFDILFEDVASHVAAANLGRAAEVLEEDDTGSTLVASADLKLEAVGRRRIAGNETKSRQHRRVQ